VPRRPLRKRVCEQAFFAKISNFRHKKDSQTVPARPGKSSTDSAHTRLCCRAEEQLIHALNGGANFRAHKHCGSFSLLPNPNATFTAPCSRFCAVCRRGDYTGFGEASAFAGLSKSPAHHCATLLRLISPKRSHGSGLTRQSSTDCYCCRRDPAERFFDLITPGVVRDAESVGLRVGRRLACSDAAFQPWPGPNASMYGTRGNGRRVVPANAERDDLRKEECA